MRVINFSAGPSAIPLPALEQAREELTDFSHTGMSIMEQSHRAKDYEGVHNEAIALICELLSVPETHQVLFMQGGAHLQFCTVPLCFLSKERSADYIITDHWSQRALEEAQAVGRARVACTTEEPGKFFRRIPQVEEINLDPHAAYVHITTNNTLYGTQWKSFPSVGELPLVADMSSDFLSQKTDVSKLALGYAGAQKNLGPSGVVVVLIRKDFMERFERQDLPKSLKYSTYAKHNSLWNTPPTFTIYMIRNVLKWVKEIGGLAQLEAWNLEKARLIYNCLDQNSCFYNATAAKECRSNMNVVFRLPTPELDAAFISQAKEKGMVGLKGHRLTGGIRASIYNAVSIKDVQTLCDFMNTFAKTKG